MNKITVKIDGMACGMCEAHICGVIRKICPTAKRVKASRTRGEATFLYDGAIDGQTLKDAITETGYFFVSVSEEPHKKRELFG